jgi:hypothetical protein
MKQKDSRNPRSLQRRNIPAHHRRERDPRDHLPSRRCESPEHTDLDAERAEVGEAAEGVGGDGEGAWGERVGRVLDVVEGCEGGVSVGERLGGRERRRD